jgi:PAS domain S-box-containing protein
LIQPGRTSLKVAIIYAVVGCLWVLASDRVLLWLFPDLDQLARLETLKGWFFVLASAGLLAGLVYHYVAVHQRESEKQQEIDRELHRRTGLLENILANIPAYVFWKDRDSVYLGCNQRFASVAGVGRPENIVGKTDFDLAWRREEAETTRISDRRVMEKRMPLLEVEEKHRQSDGGEATYLVSKVPLIDNAGGVMGIVGICTDITLRKRSEEELRRVLLEAQEARSRLSAILASAAEGLLVTDRGGRVTLMNEAAEELLGVDQAKVLGQPVQRAIGQAVLLERLLPVLTQKKSGVVLDVRLPATEGRPSRFLQARTSAFHAPEGGIAGMITVLLDTTEAHETDRMKTEFISAAARDFRGPLASILGFSELLLSPEGLGPEERHRFLSFINEEASTLSRIVKNHLDIAFIESEGELVLEKAPCDLTDLLGRLARYHAGKASRHRLELHLPETPVEAFVDRSRIEQVLNNVLGNAIKYSPDGGLVRVEGEPSGEDFRITVSDQGRGMSAEERERIFEKFYRGPVSSRGTEGLGLGMNIARHIVEAHGGTVKVESAPGDGTTVGITLPLHLKEPSK